MHKEHQAIKQFRFYYVFTLFSKSASALIIHVNIIQCFMFLTLNCQDGLTVRLRFINVFSFTIVYSKLDHSWSDYCSLKHKKCTKEINFLKSHPVLTDVEAY